MGKRQLNVKIDSDLYDALSEKANANGISVAFLIETLASLFVTDKITVQKKTVVDIKIDGKEV